MLVLKNIVKKSQGGKAHILDGLHLHLLKNEYVEIIYDNKTERDSLLKILAAIDLDYEGQYLLHNTDIKCLTEEERKQFRVKNIGLVIRKINLINELTVQENLELPFIYSDVAPATSRLVDEVLQRFNLTHKRSHYPQNLSPYLRLKTAIAQTLLSQPPVIIVEYDVNTLTSDDHLELTHLLYSLNEEGMSILSFIQEEHSTSLAHRKLFLHKGKISVEPL